MMRPYRWYIAAELGTVVAFVCERIGKAAGRLVERADAHLPAIVRTERAIRQALEADKVISPPDRMGDVIAERIRAERQGRSLLRHFRGRAPHVNGDSP